MIAQHARRISPDYSRRCGGSAIGARLRRLSYAIDHDAALAYRAAGIEFEQRWFGLVNLLDRFGPLTVDQIAAALNVSPTEVKQVYRSLRARSFVTAARGNLDARRRLLNLTSTGKAVVAALRPLWSRMEAAAAALNDEAGDVVAALDRVERALAEQSLLQRIANTGS